MPRSGSSMVAGLLAAHGIWTGTLDLSETRWNPRGSYENRPLKELVQRHFGPPPVLDRQDIERESDDLFLSEVMPTLRADGYKGGYWLFKCSVLYHKLFESFDPIYVTVRRDALSVIRSYRRTGIPGWVDFGPAVAHRSAVLDSLELAGAFRMDSDRLIRREYAQVHELFRALGIEFSKNIADHWIDPDLWHF